MAQVDPNIALSIRPVQIPLEESPLNRMRGYAEYENALLKSQETQRGIQQRNALSRIRASGLDIDSPEYLSLVAQQAPDALESEANRQLKRMQLREAQETANLRQKELEAKNIDTALEQFNQQYNPALLETEDEALERLQAMYVHPVLGPSAEKLMPLHEAARLTMRDFNRNREGYVMTQMGLKGKDILEAQAKKNDTAYADYLMDKVVNDPDAKVMSEKEFISTRGQPSAATGSEMTPAAAPAATSAVTTAPPEAGVTVSAENTLLAPGVAELLRSRDPRAKETAKILQARFENRIKSRQFTGEFANVDIAEDRIAELKKQPQTPEVVAKIASLQEMVSTAKKGKAPKIDVIVGPQEKEFEKELGKGQAKELLESRTRAEDAREILSTVKIGRDILKSGAITGAGADFFVGLNQALKTAGVKTTSSDAAVNSQAYAATMANNVGKLIKQFGAGTGLSNADRDYAEKMAGGKISLDKKALEKILDIQDRAAQNVIKRHNEKVKGIKTNISLTVEMDEPTAPPAAPKPPAIGTVQEGYRFKGGNPADQKNWEKVK
jgi:hypothetical protein